jgi:hypothetical protein
LARAAASVLPPLLVEAIMAGCVTVTFRLDFPARCSSRDEVEVRQDVFEIEAAPAVWNLHA